MKSISYSLTRYRSSRHWAVWKHEGDKAPQLLCVTLYKKGALCIINELES